MSREKLKKNRIFVIYGPTASGKTNLAIKLAKKINGEIINADSRQIYKYMNIGTNKEPLQGVKGHLFDITTPDKQISLAQYQKLAFEAIAKILKKGKTPIIIGGTGLYISAITRGYAMPKVKPNKKLRKQLEKLSAEELQNKLIKLNKKKFQNLNRSDQNNSRRLMRAIEVESGKNKGKPAEDGRNGKNFSPGNYEFVFKKPKYKKETLFRKINRRVEKMFEEGLVREVKRLLKKGYNKNLEVMKGMGYKEVTEYLEGKITLEEAKELIKLRHRQYVKRQETWFKKYIDIKSSKE